MKIGGFPLVRIGGIEILVDYSWPVMLFVVAVISENFFSQSYAEASTAILWAMSAVVSLLVFLSVLVRELARAFVAKRFEIKLTNMRLQIFGCPVFPEARSGRHEFLIALSGWGTSISAGFFSLGIYTYLWFAHANTPLRGVAAGVAAANFILAAVHMIPGFPLDGGRILRAILWDRWNDPSRATKVVSQIGNGLGLFFIIFGVLQFLVTQNLFAGLIFLVGIFMKQSSAAHFRSTAEQQSLGNVVIGQVMNSHVVTVDWLVSVDELVRDICRHRVTEIPVFNREDLIGMVRLDGVKSVSKELWTFKQVRDIMVPIEDVSCTNPDADATEVLRQMESEKITCMPVMKDNRMVGIVSRSDILKLFRIKSDLGIN
jgi:Zn-dependent protease